MADKWHFYVQFGWNHGYYRPCFWQGFFIPVKTFLGKFAPILFTTVIFYGGIKMVNVTLKDGTSKAYA